jgi:hypothetical protein
MTDEEFTKDRIEWRGMMHSLPNDQCFRFQDLTFDKQSFLKSFFKSTEIPVFVCWRDSSTWTAITPTRIHSSVLGAYANHLLSELDKNIYPLEGESEKSCIEYMALGSFKKTVWAPAGSTFCALMNILLMFPLRRQEQYWTRE